jgi:hypothetical protein
MPGLIWAFALSILVIDVVLGLAQGILHAALVHRLT